MRYFLAGYSLMGPQRASRLRRGVGVQALLALVLCASQLLCLHLLHLLHLLYLLYLLQLLLQGGLHPLLQCFLLPWLSSFSSCSVLLVQVPCFSPSHSKIRSSNRHAVALGNRKRRRHRRPFSRAARPVPISFLQEVNL